MGSYQSYQPEESIMALPMAGPMTIGSSTKRNILMPWKQPSFPFGM